MYFLASSLDDRMLVEDISAKWSFRWGMSRSCVEDEMVWFDERVWFGERVENIEWCPGKAQGDAGRWWPTDRGKERGVTKRGEERVSIYLRKEKERLETQRTWWGWGRMKMGNSRREVNVSQTQTSLVNQPFTDSDKGIRICALNQPSSLPFFELSDALVLPLTPSKVMTSFLFKSLAMHLSN